MTNIIELIINFKETLMNNYYDKTNEKDKFLQWLENNTNYSNGEYNILEDTFIPEQETETHTTNEWNNRLKNLVQGWSRSKSEKQEYWNNTLKERSSYLNGIFSFDKINDKYVKQTVTGVFSYETYYNGKHYYLLEINVSPGVIGQSFSFSPEFNIYRTHQANTGVYTVEISSDEIITGSVILVAESFVKDGVVYSGGSVTVSPLNI